MSFYLLKQKFRAMLVHGIATLIIASFSAYLVYGVWYPGQLAKFTGGGQLFLLIVLIEVCLGPLMSLVVYNPAKSRTELFRDYMIISAFQAGALLYGLHSTYISRPVYNVFVVDRIEIISAVELSDDDLSYASEEFARLPILGPRHICVERPSDPKERSDILISALTKKKDIELMPKYYRECKQNEIIDAALASDVLFDLLRQNKKNEEVATIQRIGAFKWLLVKSRFGTWIEIYPQSNYEKREYLAVDPFLH